jgi:hypothetical protein
MMIVVSGDAIRAIAYFSELLFKHLLPEFSAFWT